MSHLCSTKQLVIKPNRIAFLKFILEGYDGMAILTTIEPKSGEIVIRYIPSFKEALDKLLTCLHSTLQPE